MSDQRNKAMDDAEHEAEMQRLKAEMDAKIAAAKEKRDLLMVHTGPGKGKSTAAFGLLLRQLAYKRRCVVVQFVKSGDVAVERFLRGPLLTWHRVGDGFTWDTQNRAADIASCRAGWDLVLRALQDDETQFVLLDEINVVLDYGYLPIDEVVTALVNKKPGRHVVCTGRGAPTALMAAADLVTEMGEIKHPFQAGVQAQPGIEF